MGIVILIYLGTFLSSTLGVRAISGSFGKVKFFYKKYFPPEIANNSVVSRSLLSCADQCLQQQCANMIYDRVSRGCYINGGFLLFPNGTVFQARALELNRFVDFQQVN